MTTSLPHLLTTHDLPHAELQAAALDGDVFRLDRAFCSVAEFDVPWRRATSLGDHGADGRVIARMSAAWVWGAADPPSIHEAFAGDGVAHAAQRAGAAARDGVLVSAVGVDPADVVDFGEVLVTSPTRTVVDLARADAFADDVVRRLIAEHRVTRAGCEVVLERTERLPHRRRARARLDAVGLGVVGLAVRAG